MKKGISLISVIITVLVIAILAAVMVPSGIDKINSAKLTAFNDNILTLKQEANTYLMQNDEYPAKIDGSGNPIVYSIAGNSMLVAEATKKGEQNDIFYVIDLDKVKMDNKDIGVGKTIDDFYILAKISGNVYYAKGIKVGNVVYYTKQNKGDGVIATVPSGAPIPNGAYDGIVNSPKLSAGMTAVKWNGNAWVAADNQNKNNEWYDYTQGINRWANVKLVDDSLLVWIPRYTYKIISGEHTSTAGVIDIRFSAGIKDDTVGGYRIHPAFYWGGWDIPASAPMIKQPGGAELTGIWVGKFEASNSGGKIKIQPNAASWAGITIGDMFTTCRQMQTTNSGTYGISPDSNVIDTHLLKNSEWGAVAYLSKYALGATEVASNYSLSYITANGNIVANKDESTTRNEYGIYDMNGCTWEYVSTYVNGASADLCTAGTAIYNAAAKYKDVFPKSVANDSTGNYSAANQAYGHALYETSSGVFGQYSWFADYASFPSGSSLYFQRGGENGGSEIYGLFAYQWETGGDDAMYGFRVSVVCP